MRNNDVMYPIRINKELKDKLIEHCKENEITLAALIRRLLKEYVAREEIK